jgi:hypothetical protein
VRRDASGKLKNNLTYTFWKRGKRNVMIFTVRDKKIRDYADVIEEGRRPNSKQPPTKPIMDWLKIKGIILRNNKGQFMKRGESNYRGVAWVIARSIGKRGIVGIHYFREAFENTFDGYDPKIINAAIMDFEFRLKANKYIK